MAKKKAAKAVTKSDFLRDSLGRDLDLELGEINRRWAKAGHPGEISSALYHKIRRDLGIRSVWTWGPAESSRPTPARPPRSSGQCYQLKVTLRGIRPPIWRRLVVPDCTLRVLHEIIQVAMGWDDYHLYAFEVGDEEYSDPNPAVGDLDMEDASRVRLGDLIPGEKFKFRYTYDFGDDWKHEILVEKVVPPGEGQSFPHCPTGKRACPPEDVGGIWGYQEFLEAIQDPEHDRHAELLEWVGGAFDPEAFDLEAINAELREMSG